MPACQRVAGRVLGATSSTSTRTLPFHDVGEDPTESSPARPIPFELPEYDHAFAEFIFEVAHGLAMANSPLLRQIPVLSAPGTASSVVDARDLEQLDLPAQPVGFAVTNDLRAIRDGDFEPLVVSLSEGSDELGSELMRLVFGTMDRVTQATGNIVKASGEPTFEAIYEALDRMEWTLTEDDELSLPTLVMHPETIEKLPVLTPEQEQALEDLKRRKLEELLAGRRRRRLS